MTTALIKYEPEAEYVHAEVIEHPKEEPIIEFKINPVGVMIAAGFVIGVLSMILKTPPNNTNTNKNKKPNPCHT